MYTNKEMSIFKTNNRDPASIGKFKIKTTKNFVNLKTLFSTCKLKKLKTDIS